MRKIRDRVQWAIKDPAREMSTMFILYINHMQTSQILTLHPSRSQPPSPNSNMMYSWSSPNKSEKWAVNITRNEIPFHRFNHVWINFPAILKLEEKTKY